MRDGQTDGGGLLRCTGTGDASDVRERRNDRSAVVQREDCWKMWMGVTYKGDGEEASGIGHSTFTVCLTGVRTMRSEVRRMMS